ncbi:DUF294 nucleotidyltransferase-like domain-containing protein [Niallia oryzisoli]|uniref:DUF294 nucleotidyltransferase-like domain-containing protein n=1 Tax=Niallia oryzisoli TaxID=1737571 RepID=A0ABZ2C7Y4_9BACI
MTNFVTYESIRMWREAQIYEYTADTHSLNSFHDLVMYKVLKAAINRLNLGDPPCDFCWFIAGSGGRMEQEIISDQDHGIIFEISSEKNEAYFLKLGKEVSFGLNLVGYPYCQGNIMSSNPLWCKSIDAWLEQLYKWMEERSLESIRNLQIFYDARCLYGNADYVQQLKLYIYDYQNQQPILLKRLMDSVMHIKNAIGPLGQIIVIDHGRYQGSINLKYSAFLPYVNAIRILAIKEGLYETSTLERMEALFRHNDYADELARSKTYFAKLLDYRLTLVKGNTYEDTHFLKIKDVNKSDRKEMKQILKEGIRLHQYVSRLVLSSCSG